MPVDRLDGVRPWGGNLPIGNLPGADLPLGNLRGGRRGPCRVRHVSVCLADRPAAARLRRHRRGRIGGAAADGFFPVRAAGYPQHGAGGSSRRRAAEFWVACPWVACPWVECRDSRGTGPCHAGVSGSAARLFAAVHAVAAAQPRTFLAASYPDRLQDHWVARSAVFNFPDLITVQVAAAGPTSTLVLYSRSVYGRSDLGVNRRGCGLGLPP